MGFQANINSDRVHRILLQERPEGTYIFVFERPDSQFPEKDYLQNDLEMAKRCCLEDYDVPLDGWQEVPDDPRMGI